MRRDEVIQKLRQHYRGLAENYGIQSLALFGSVVRDEATDTSDVDVLVDFGTPPTFDQYLRLKIFLADTVQCKDDVVTRRALKGRMRTYVEKEAGRVT